MQIKNLSPANILSSVDFNAAVVSNLVNLDKYWILNFCDNIWSTYSETNSSQSISVKTFNISGSSSNSEINELIFYFDGFVSFRTPTFRRTGSFETASVSRSVNSFSQNWLIGVFFEILEGLKFKNWQRWIFQKNSYVGGKNKTFLQNRASWLFGKFSPLMCLFLP